MGNASKEEAETEKERIRLHYRSYLSSISIDPREIEKEMDLRYQIALRMMMDDVPYEKIRYYTLLSYTQIEYVRLTLLPEAIAGSEQRVAAHGELAKLQPVFIPTLR